MKQLYFIFILVVAGLATWSSNAQINQSFAFNDNSLLQHVKELSSDTYQGRRSGTAGVTLAKNYIIAQIQALNVLPLTAKYEQPFQFIDGRTKYSAVNILGKIVGSHTPDKHIVISAHYDHEGIKNGQIYNGADDNASGVSALLAFAEYFKTHPPKHSVILAFFDGEELGLQGAEFFVNNPVVSLQSIVLNINLDMISRNDKQELYVTGIQTHPNLKKAYAKRDKITGIHVIAGHDGTDGKQDWTLSSDHAHFHLNGIPFLYFGVEDHEDYHKPTDDFENIHPEFYKKAVHSIISIFKQIDASTF
ncbi:M28 family peptidase [Bizionia sediminis]|uniref:M28 family peptidase n=1 Tax=Bizionia sediminis TaxID=1737064 RepID=A0ABW5KSC8_9FLAO